MVLYTFFLRSDEIAGGTIKLPTCIKSYLGLQEENNSIHNIYTSIKNKTNKRRMTDETKKSIEETKF
jgi:hypothetical protein